MMREKLAHLFNLDRKSNARVEDRADADNELIHGQEIMVNGSPPEEVITSKQPELQRVIEGLEEAAHIRVYLPNSLWVPGSVERMAIRHTARSAVVSQDAGVVDFDALSGRGGKVPMILVAKGIGAKYQGVYYHDAARRGDKNTMAFSMGAQSKKGADTAIFKQRTVNEETYIPDDQEPEVMFLIKHSYGRPYGAQTLSLARAALECSEDLAGSNIKYTPEVAVLPFPRMVKDKISAATSRADIPISSDLERKDLAQELILYPPSTRRGIELIECWEKTGGATRMTSGQQTVKDIFPTVDSKEQFIDQMTDDLYWLLNWPARNSTISANGHLQWRRINDFNLNNDRVRDDLVLSRRQREILQNNVSTILEGREDDCRMDNIRDDRVREKLKTRDGGFRFRAGDLEWMPFVLKDLIVDSRYGCFITDFESSEVEEVGEVYSISDHELWIYDVLYEFLTMAVSILDSTANSELINLIRGRSMSDNKEIKDYGIFYERIKEIFLRVLRKLAQKKDGEIEIRLSDDENELEVTLNYREKSVAPKTFKFHILDFLKM